jgi:N4-gp56 family major capsid protein
MKLFWNLQLFAEAGDLVNATGNYVNAYTGSITAFDDAHTLAPVIKDFYDTELLENARVETYFAQFAKRVALPAGHGGNIEFRKWNTFARAGQLQEGVIPTGQKFGQTKLTATVNQFGTYTSVSDRLEYKAYDDVIGGATEEMGASLAETQEALIRDALFTGTNVMYANVITNATGAVGAPPTSMAGLVDDATYNCRMTAEFVNKLATKLKKDKVPRLNGKYYAVIHPSVAEDLRQSNGWLEAHKYAAPEELFNGEIGELHGIRFIEDTFAPVIRGADLASDSATLAINYTTGYTGSITSVAFDGGTVEADELIGREIMINGVVAEVTDNTANSITFASTNFGTIANDTVIYPGEGGKDGIAVYATYLFGKDGYAIIDPAGGNAEMIVHDKSEIGGPLNQFSTIGYKFESNGATILYPERVLRAMTTSSYSSTDEAN